MNDISSNLKYLLNMPIYAEIDTQTLKGDLKIITRHLLKRVPKGSKDASYVLRR